MPISCLVVTGHSDRPETYLFIGLHKMGIEIEVLCPETAPHRQLLLDANVPTYDLELKSRFDKTGIALIKSHLARKNFMIIHAFNNQAVSNALIASKNYACKFIAYRGIEANVSYYDPASWTTYLHPRVDKIVCVANAIRDYFHNMRFLGIKCPLNKAVTIYKGHDASWYQEDALSLTVFGLPKEGFFVGCTVNDRPRKGLHYLIRATYLLPPGLPIYFVFIGHINNKKLLSLIEKSPYCNNIHLLGFRENVLSIIKSCDVCILPAIKREGLPKGIIEGMIQGVAPIVTNSGGSPELIEHEKSGLIVPPKSSESIADAILRYYNDAELLKRIRINAPKRIQNEFHVDATINNHIDLYKELTY